MQNAFRPCRKLNAALTRSPWSLRSTVVAQSQRRRSHAVAMDAGTGHIAANGSAHPPAFDVPTSHGSFKRTLEPIDVSKAYGLEPGSMRLARWQSEHSGLRVTWLDVPGPLANAYCTLATEILDDTGRPHTLEQCALIFLGSEQYPYKGVLDTLANRAFASGTNAWTANTHTAYTVTTAGATGFLNFLPAFIDHLLYATITDEGFTTEVFHVNGKGQDAGVVYSEMQGRENGADDLMELRTQRLLYPKSSGYRSETGGLMDALRDLSAQQIRDYHAATYVPHNLNIIVTGHVDPVKLLAKLEDEVEPSIRKHHQANGPQPAGWKRPWIETSSAVPPTIAEGGVSETVPFPERDESSGQWQGTWIGPPFEDQLTAQALDVLALYLSDSAVSPLYKELIEVEEPACTGPSATFNLADDPDIYFDSSEALTMRLSMYAMSVPTELLPSIRDKIVGVMRSVAYSGLDMSRIAMLIEREKLKAMSQMETRAESAMADVIIGDFLFGNPSGADLASAINELGRFDELAKWSADQWRQLLRRWYVDAPCLSVIGKPSASLADKLEASVKKRVDRRQKELGEEGLKKLADELAAAEKMNNRPIPDEMISSFPVPSTKDIPWIAVPSARPAGASPALDQRPIDEELAAHLAADSKHCPLFVQFDQIRSHFVTVTIHLSPEHVPTHLVPLITLYTSSFFSLPVTRDGKRVAFEDVIKQLDLDTISYSARFASTPEDYTISIQVHKSKYAIAVGWLRDLLHSSVFDPARLKVVASKAVQSLPAEKRDGDEVCTCAEYMLTSDETKSVQLGENLLKRIETEPVVLERLSSEPDAVVAELEQLRSHLAKPETWRIAVKGDVLGLDQPVSTLIDGLKLGKVGQLEPWRPTSAVLSQLGKKPARKALIMSMASIESSYGKFLGRCPDSFTHPDVPALRVASTVLNNLESFFWREIRGAGLAYGANLIFDFSRGLAALRIYKSPDAAKAFLAAKSIVDRLVSGALEIDALTLEAAKSSLAYSSAASQSTLSDAASSSFLNAAIRAIPRDYSSALLDLCQDVPLAEVLRVLRQYVAPIFDSTSSIAVVSSTPTKVDEISKQLEGLGYEVEVRTLDVEGDGSGSEGSGSETGSDSGSDAMQS